MCNCLQHSNYRSRMAAAVEASPLTAPPLAAPPPPGGLTTEEAALVQQLRAKWGGGCADAQGGASVSSAPSMATLSAVAVSTCGVCASCSGEGIVVETYEHRSLERCCAECGGDGVRLREGSAPAAAAPCRPAPGSLSHSRSSGRPTASSRLAAYERELEGLKASLAGCADKQQVRLTAELILQLERQLARLRSS